MKNGATRKRKYVRPQMRSKKLSRFFFACVKTGRPTCTSRIDEKNSVPGGCPTA